MRATSGSAAEQRRNRILRNADARPEDKRGNGNAHIAVHRQRSKPTGCHAEYDNSRGNNIITAVLTGSHQHRRVDSAADIDVERAHPQLNQHGYGKNPHQHRRERYGSRMQNAVERGFEELEADQNDDERDDQSRDVLGASVAERMLRIRLLAGNLEADNGNQAGQTVRQVVECVRRDGNRPCKQTNDQLERKQEQVACQSDRTGQHAEFFTHPRIAGVFRIADENMDKCVCHRSPFIYRIL